jgi:hypothetical protein
LHNIPDVWNITGNKKESMDDKTRSSRFGDNFVTNDGEPVHDDELLTPEDI